MTKTKIKEGYLYEVKQPFYAYVDFDKPDAFTSVLIQLNNIFMLLDEDENGFYKILFNNKIMWVHEGYIEHFCKDI